MILQKSFVQISQLLIKTSMKLKMYLNRKNLREKETLRDEHCNIDIPTIHSQLKNRYQKMKQEEGCYRGGKQPK